MEWMQKLINRHNGKEKCLVCERSVGKDAAVIEYKHMDGMDKAFLCKACEKKFGETKMDGIDEAV